MSCDEVRPLLREATRGALDEQTRARVYAHLAACPACREVARRRACARSPARGAIAPASRVAGAQTASCRPACRPPRRPCGAHWAAGSFLSPAGSPPAPRWSSACVATPHRRIRWWPRPSPITCGWSIVIAPSTSRAAARTRSNPGSRGGWISRCPRYSAVTTSSPCRGIGRLLPRSEGCRSRLQARTAHSITLRLSRRRVRLPRNQPESGRHAGGRAPRARLPGGALARGPAGVRASASDLSLDEIVRLGSRIANSS